MLELRLLGHFEAVHRLGSFRLAADEQALSQSAITKSIQRLEDRLGVQLFDRTTRSVRATAAGDQLVDRARELLRQAEELERGARLLRGGEAGNVRLGASPLPTESLVAPALGGFVAGRPALEVELVTAPQAALVEQLLAHELDLLVLGGVGFEPIRFQDELAIQRLPAEPAVIVARSGHPLVRSGAGSEAYLEYPWAVPRLSADDMARFPEPFASEIARRGIPQLKLESVSACLELALRSDVLTGVPRSVGRRAASRIDVALVPYPFELRVGCALLTNRRRSLGPAASALRDAVREVARAEAERAS